MDPKKILFPSLLVLFVLLLPAGSISAQHMPAVIPSSPAGGGYAAASFPFYDGFESGSLGVNWTAGTTNQGRVTVGTTDAYAGDYSLLLDCAVSPGSLSIAYATLTIDLSGQEEVDLDFYWMEYDDENHAWDMIYISDDYGANWHSIFSLNNGPSTYQQTVIDLDESASALGVSLNDHFQIKFQFYDDYSIPWDGYSFDEINVRAGEPGSFGKIAPTNWATDQSTSPTLSWGASSGATTYEYCYDTTNDDVCSSWISNGSSTSVALSGLDLSTYYYWQVRASNSAGMVYADGSEGQYWSFETLDPPPTPGDISATDGDYTDKVQVSWSASNGATHYEIWRSASGDSSDAIRLAGNRPGSPYNDTSPTPGTYYAYYVKACHAEGCSGFTNDSKDSGYRKLTAPTGIAASDGTFTDKVRVRWNAVTGATHYQVYANTSDDSASASRRVSDHPASPYDDTRPFPGETNYFWVKACGEAGCSDFSASDSGWRALTPPTGVSASDGTFTDKVQVAWEHNGAASYEVWRHTAENSSAATRLTSGGWSPYNDESVLAGETYFYWVKSCNAYRCSGFSEADSGYPGSLPPPNVSASSGDYDDKVRITWDALDDATHYEIWRYPGDDRGFAIRLASNHPDSPYDDTSAVPGKSYGYQVKACNAVGCGAFSHGHGGYRAFTPPSGITATDGTFIDKVRVSWQAAEGAAHYEVWRHTSDNSGAAVRLVSSHANSPYDDSGAINNQPYYYWVKACNAERCSDFSAADTGYRLGLSEVFLPLLHR